MKVDLTNRYPSVGEAKQLPLWHGATVPYYGTCSTRIDFVGRAAVPRDEVKGLVACPTFYT
ncbi:hypothetical protein DENIT_30192 [Pseudomonas veronii]|uniref:Deoxyribonuclease I n=1 Tax=Ectopseudomonas oleovorans TaxID=301 RepID=A0A653BD23_ECTOL|nr:hypothetical protein DENIT_30192 [Pseudomonas veronii]CAE6924573.1 Deoxyribonuclease I [Pseudomonas oleovorans]